MQSYRVFLSSSPRNNPSQFAHEVALSVTIEYYDFVPPFSLLLRFPGRLRMFRLLLSCAPFSGRWLRIHGPGDFSH